MEKVFEVHEVCPSCEGTGLYVRCFMADCRRSRKNEVREMKTCGECKHWEPDDCDPGWPFDGLCCAPLPAPVERLEKNIAGWDFYIDKNDTQAEACACFEKKEG